MIEDITLYHLLEIAEKGDTGTLTAIILAQKERWNQLIKESRKARMRIKLSNLSLQGEDIRERDFSGVDIEDVDLSGSNLSGADFSGASIKGAKLKGADLRGARFEGATISQTDMSNAKLYNANIQGTYFTGSVNLFGAYLKEDEHMYSTSPEITKKGFRMIEAYEHGTDEEGHSYYH